MKKKTRKAAIKYCAEQHGISKAMWTCVRKHVRKQKKK